MTTEDTIGRHSQLIGLKDSVNQVYKKRLGAKAKRKKKENERKRAQRRRNMTQELTVSLVKREVFHYKCSRVFEAFPLITNEYKCNYKKTRENVQAYKDAVVKRVESNWRCNDQPK